MSEGQVGEWGGRRAPTWSRGGLGRSRQVQGSAFAMGGDGQRPVRGAEVGRKGRGGGAGEGREEKPLAWNVSFLALLPMGNPGF